MDDIIPPGKRSIRNIPLRKVSVQHEKTVHHKHVEQPVHEHRDHHTPHDTPDHAFGEIPEVEIIEARHSLFFYIAAILIPVLVIVVGLGFYSLKWSGADIVVTPKTQNISISLPVIMTKSDTAQSADTLSYTVVTKSIEQSIEVPTSGDQQVTQKASGQIVIYNNFSTAPQKLIANTRFQTPDGKIFRITKAVTIPGQTTESGKTVAGNVEATVTADVAGPTYNIGMSDFTIPGFKGDPRFEKIYARSKTAMTGGASGTTKKVLPADVAKKTNEAIAAMQDNLIQQLTPPEHVILKGGFTFTTRELSRETKSANTVIIKETIDIQALAIAKESLSSFIVTQSPLSNAKEGAYIKDFTDVTIEVASGIDLIKSETVNATLGGKALVTWYYNAEKLAKDLAGLPKDQARAILAKYAGIQTAESIVRPFWKTAFPVDPKDIHVSEARSLLGS